MKVLFAFFHGIGDAIMFMPALRMYKEKYPQRKIGILCTSITKESFDLSPYVDEVFVSYNNSPRYGIFPLFLLDRFRINRELSKIKKKESFDKTFFVLPHGLGSYFPIPGKLLSTFPFLYNFDKNEIKKFCKILNVGENKNWPLDFYTEVFSDKNEERKAKSFLKKNKGKIAIVHLASTSGRRGFNGKEKKDIMELLIKNKFKIVLLNEEYLLKGCYPCYPKTISFTVGLIKNADLFIGPDSGPANLAAALKTPSIIISKVIPPNLRFLDRKNLVALYKYNYSEIEKTIKKFS